MRRALAVASITLTLGLGLAGCSQISALAPVGGDALAEVRYGAIDVLLANGVDLLEAPTCTTATAGADDPSAVASSRTSTPAASASAGDGASTVTCTGTTNTGEPITVVSSTAANAQLDVTVGDRPIYSGPLQIVLDEAARP